ncbi:MAG: hypothetical protein A2X64_02780 [Ignavibacteria bacterium GWF2_33_9]|nr:MAG: hypothetical protein A2X64_02780 [Ignavibacteria bacterium GWF2_33_9]
MRKALLSLLFAMSPIFAIAETNDFGLTFGGFVKNDFFYDTRQTVNIREGHFLLYPAGQNFDANGIDLNDASTTNFLSIQTRLTGKITAPDAFGAKVSGIIEADFFGNENASFVDANGFRLRHAYAKLNWSNTEFLFGQMWHPMFNTEIFSEVISFNTGAPFNPFSRNPQIRITHKMGDFSILGALIEQRDFVSAGGSTPLRNAVIPEIHARLSYKKVFNGKTFQTAVGGGYKTLRPLLATIAGGKNYESDETISGFTSTAFVKFAASNFTWKAQAVYGQNITDLTMMGGYAVSEVLDAATNKVKYTPINSFASWTEFIQKVGKFQFALWAGYTEILGSDDKILIYSDQVGGTLSTLRGTTANNSSAIKNMMRVSPRVVLTSDKINFAFELEYTSAGYAKKDTNGNLMRDEFGVISETENISNIRSLFSVILKF